MIRTLPFVGPKKKCLMITETDYDRQLRRENALEAKNIVYQMEKQFFDNISVGVRYLLTAIAGAIVIILGFVGAVGPSVSNIWVYAISLFPIFAGLVGGGVSIAISTWISREDFKVSITTFLAAMHHDKIHLFTDTAMERDQKLLALFWSWLISFLLFSLGALWFGISLILLDFKESESPSLQAAVAADMSPTEDLSAETGQNGALNKEHGNQNVLSDTKISDALPPLLDEDEASVSTLMQAEEDDGVLSGD